MKDELWLAFKAYSKDHPNVDYLEFVSIYKFCKAFITSNQIGVALYVQV